MRIKASRITSLTDARYFAAREVDFLGFNLEAGTEGYLDPIQMRAIREWIEGPVVVGEFGRTPAAVAAEAAAFYGLEAVEVGPGAGPLAPLQGLTVLFDVSEVLADRAALEEALRASAGQVAYTLAAFPAGDESWRTAWWQELCRVRPVLVQFDLPAASWAEALQWLQPAGLSLRGGAEEKVGVKSFDEIDTLCETLGIP
jgi:phosphoribosylanthranilate isomerase